MSPAASEGAEAAQGGASMRIYLPVTRADVDILRAGGRLGVPRAAYGVTAGLRRAHPRAGLEELEYAALLAAAQEAGAGEPDRQIRRAIAAADVPEDMVTPTVEDPAEPATPSDPGPASAGGPSRSEPVADPAGVTLTAPVHARQVASIHVDEVPGSDAADLLWHDVTELDVVAELLAALD